MKPSMTGPGRPGREQMINLSAMSGGEIGWNYTEMLAGIAANAAPIQRITQPTSRGRSLSAGHALSARCSGKPCLALHAA
jgi:D-alanine-D-alanine ligase